MYESCVHRQPDRQPDFLQCWDLSRSSSSARNIYNTEFCENRLSGSQNLRELCSQTDRQPDFLQGCDLSRSFSRAQNIISNFVKIVRAVLEIYESCVHGQTDRQTNNPVFSKVGTYLGRLLMAEIQIIPNFVKIVRTDLEIYESCVLG